MGLLNDQGANE